MQVTIQWVPASSGQYQEVQFRLEGASSWTTFSTNLPMSQNSETVTGLLDYEVYEFRVLNYCEAGGPIATTPIPWAQLGCPIVTETSRTETSLSYQFTHLGGDINSYDVTLLNDAGMVTISTQVKNPPFGSPITGTFINLTPTTNYKIKVTPKVKDGTTVRFQKTDCGLLSTGTSSPSACAAPTNLTVTLG